MQEFFKLEPFFDKEKRSASTVSDVLNLRISQLSNHGAGALLSRLQKIYTANDCDFILGLCARYDRVRLGFEYFTLLNPLERVDAADALSNIQLRSGWVNIGVPVKSVRSIFDHEWRATEMVFDLYADEPNLKQLETTIRYHDIIEAVTGDFTPHCGITREEKKRLEDLAILLLTQSRPYNPQAQMVYESFQLFEGYMPDKEHLRIKAKDTDLLTLMTEASEIRHAHPDWMSEFAVGYKKGGFDKTVTSGLKTDRAKAVYEVMNNSAYHGEDPRLIWSAAFLNVLQKDHVYAAFCKSRGILEEASLWMPPGMRVS